MPFFAPRKLHHAALEGQLRLPTAKQLAPSPCNGQISDPGGPALYTAPTALQLTDFDRQQSNPWPIWLLMGIIFAIGATLWSHKRHKSVA